MREASIHRVTKETDVELSLNLDGPYSADIRLGEDGFLNKHFGSLLYALIGDLGCSLTLNASGDVDVDYHHLVEDVGLVLGEAVSAALGDFRGINRYGFSIREEKNVEIEVAVDIGGRPYLVYDVELPDLYLGDFDLGLIRHFFRSLSDGVGMNLHICQTGSADIMPVYSRIFKDVGKSLKMAVAIDPRAPDQCHSSKGRIG